MKIFSSYCGVHSKVKKRNNNFQGPNTYVQTSQQQGKYECMIASLMGEKKTEPIRSGIHSMYLHYGNMCSKVSKRGIQYEMYFWSKINLLINLSIIYLLSLEHKVFQRLKL